MAKVRSAVVFILLAYWSVRAIIKMHKEHE